MIQDLKIITSPLRRYIELPEAYYIGQEPGLYTYLQKANVAFINIKRSTALLPHSETLIKLLESNETKQGAAVRWTCEFWPRLEDAEWRRTNNWKELE